MALGRAICFNWCNMNTQHESVFDPYPQGPKGENVGSITQPLPSNYLIFRAASESDGETSEGAASCMFDETIYMQPN